MVVLVKEANLKIIGPPPFTKCPAVEVWAKPELRLPPAKQNVVPIGLLSWPSVAAMPGNPAAGRAAENAYLQDVLGWRRPVGFNIVDEFWTNPRHSGGMFMYFDVADRDGHVNHIGTQVLKLTPPHKIGDRGVPKLGFSTPPVVHLLG